MSLYFYIFLSLLSIIISSPPPIPQPDYQTFVETPVVQVDDNQKSSLKNLAVAKIISESTNVNVYFRENERIEEHTIRITPINLENGVFFPSMSFSQELPDGKTLKLNSNLCKKDSVPEDKKELAENNCTAKFIENGQEYTFIYNFTLRKDEHIIISYNISIITNSKEILYKQEVVSISSLYKTGNCTFKFTIPDYYTSLGLKNNLLEKKSDRVYVYDGECPSETISEVIRYAPNQSFWKAKVNIYYSSSSKIPDDVILTFPRYYRGGKNKNKNYKITLYNNTNLKESELITNETFLKVTVPGRNNTKIGVNLETAFSNVLNEKFDVYTSENFYQIDGNIDDVIKAKVQEIINNSSSKYKDYPDYYKIGKFVSSYMTYDLSYHGKDKTPLEIYNEKKGVCEHYTILYNAMLNSIGIKTLKTFGWAFQNNETSGNQDTIGHAWTVALIDNKWIELDATWDLFDGIPAGHIFKGFKEERSYYLSRVKITREFTTNINLVDNLDDDGLIIPTIIKSYKDNESTILKSNIKTQIESTIPTIIKTYKENESTILKSNIKSQLISTIPTNLKSNIKTQIDSTIPTIIQSYKENESTILKSNIKTQINSTIPTIIKTYKENESTILKSNIKTHIEPTIPTIIKSHKENESTILKSNIKTQIESTIPTIIKTYKENESTILKSNIKTQIESTIPTIIKSYKENESTILKSNIKSQLISTIPTNLKSNIKTQIESTIPTIIKTYKNSESTILKSNIKTQIESTIPTIIKSYKENESTILKSTIKTQINSSIPTIIKSYKENESTILKSNIKTQKESSIPTIIKTYKENESSNIISSSTINGGVTPISQTQKINYDSIIKTTTIIENNSVKSNIISTFPNIKETNNITYAPEISSTSLNYTETPKVVYTVFIFQVQLINNFIRIYILSDFPTKKNDPLYLISKLYYQNLRNLQNEEAKDTTIALYATEDFDKDKIAVFSSKNEFNNIKRVEGQEVKFDNKENSEINIILLDNNKECLDTEKVEDKIKQGGLDYSKLPSDYKISQYKINSASQGCNFDLESDSIINEENKQIKLNFKNNKTGDVNAICLLSKNNEKANLIPCTLNQNVNSNYILEDYIQSNDKETLTIVQSNKLDELCLNCSLKLKRIYHNDSGKGGLKTGVIICLIIIGVLLLLGVTGLAIYFKNKTKNENSDIRKNNSNYMMNYSSSATSSQM